MYYRGASAAIVVYSITSYDSFTKAKAWVKELQKQEGIIISIAGNKCDLEAERKVDTEEAKQYAMEKGILFFETSAKAQINITEMFVDIAKKLPREKVKEEDNDVPDNGKGGKVKFGKDQKKPKDCCGK